MFKILADTCIWENLAKDPQQRTLLNVIMQLEGAGDLRLIVPRIVLEEWKRRKDRITKENTRSVSSLLKRIKDIVGKHGDGDGKSVQPVPPRTERARRTVTRTDGTRPSPRRWRLPTTGLKRNVSSTASAIGINTACSQ